MTNVGFVSAVQYKENKDLIVVRARAPGHLTDIFGPLTEEICSPDRDYSWRTILTRKEFEEGILNSIKKIDYTNFKNSVQDEDLHDAYLDVWTDMFMYQREVNKKIGLKPSYLYYDMPKEEQDRYQDWWLERLE